MLWQQCCREATAHSWNETRICRDGSVWHACKDMQALRLVFVAKVVSQATSGLAAFPWTQTDSNVIEGVLCRLLWKCCRKFVLAKDDDSNVVCSYINRELMGVFGMARHFTEVRVQRLLMMQAWARSPIDFAQPVSVVFGTWTVQEMNEFGPDGRPCNTFSNSDRWTQQVIEDMRSLCDIELVVFKLAILFSGKDQHTHLVESCLAVNIRSRRLADSLFR